MMCLVNQGLYLYQIAPETHKGWNRLLCQMVAWTFLDERTISPDKVTVQNKRDQTRSHFYSKILFITLLSETGTSLYLIGAITALIHGKERAGVAVLR